MCLCVISYRMEPNVQDSSVLAWVVGGRAAQPCNESLSLYGCLLPVAFVVHCAQCVEGSTFYFPQQAFLTEIHGLIL